MSVYLFWLNCGMAGVDLISAGIALYAHTSPAVSLWCAALNISTASFIALCSR